MRLTPSMLLNGFKSSLLPILADPTIDEVNENENCPQETIELLAQIDCRIVEIMDI